MIKCQPCKQASGQHVQLARACALSLFLLNPAAVFCVEHALYCVSSVSVCVCVCAFHYLHTILILKVFTFPDREIQAGHL